MIFFRKFLKKARNKATFQKYKLTDVGGTSRKVTMNKELYIGCHLSTSGGFENMGRDALKIGANTFAFFTRNPRGGSAKAIDPADVEALKKILEKNNFGKLVAHAPYTLNPCSATPKTRDFALMAMADDLERMGCLKPGYETGAVDDSTP